MMSPWDGRVAVNGKERFPFLWYPSSEIESVGPNEVVQSSRSRCGLTVDNNDV